MTAPSRVLHIDGDTVAFICAAACQDIFVDDFGWAQPMANTKAAEALVDNTLMGLKMGLKASTAHVFLSDPTSNWRHQVDPSYKAQRDSADKPKVLVRPLLLDYCKDYLRDKHGAVHWESLEADDVLAILATEYQGEDAVGRQIITVGADKDFRTIPGFHHTIKKDVGPRGELLVREVYPWEACRFHLMQTLAGDRVDGFPGCPGIGMERAARIIDAPVRLVPQEGVKTRGVNKGEAVTRWMSEPTRDYWACIVSHYRKAGLTEEDALRTARLANLLHADQYTDQGRITLWTPERILPFQS